MTDSDSDSSTETAYRCQFHPDAGVDRQDVRISSVGDVDRIYAGNVCARCGIVLSLGEYKRDATADDQELSA